MSEHCRTKDASEKAPADAGGSRDVAASSLHSRVTKAASSPEIEIRVDEIGQGRPVVYLHGLLGLNSHWNPTAMALAHRARSIMIELPLLGLPGPMCNVAAVSKLVAEIISIEISEPVVLVGSSFGGHVALRMTHARPELVCGLVLAGSSGLFETTIEEVIEQGLRKEVQHRPSQRWLQTKIEELFYDPASIPAGVVDRAHLELSKRRAARAMVRLSKSARRDHMGSRLGAIEAPTLVVWGRQDVVTPPRVAEEFCQLLPNAKLRWLERCGHALMIEKPAEFTQALSEFLDEVWSGRGAVGPRQEVA